MLGNEEGENLTTIRRYLKEELEKEKLLDEDWLEIVINEDFNSDTSKEIYENCIDKIKNSELTIAMYNGFSGWAPDGFNMGICHAELFTALNISLKKTSIIDIKDHFKYRAEDDAQRKRDASFVSYLKQINRPMNPLKINKQNYTSEDFRNELLKDIKKIIFYSLNERIRTSDLSFRMSGGLFVSLDWKKLKYTDRNKYITEILDELIKADQDYENIITKSYCVPDNLSVTDARAYTRRPFLKDQEIIQGHSKKKGPLHFIGVYGTATEIQVKNLVGYPDITTVKGEFGIYVWEQNMHTQMVFLTDCNTPESVKIKYRLFNNWCDSRLERDNIETRAEARYQIMHAINEAAKIVHKK